MASKRSKRTEKRAEKHTETRLKKVPKDIVRLVSEINNNEAIIEILTSLKQGNKIEEFTPKEYENFIARLQEANFLEERIIQYKEEIARMEEYVKDYRNNIEYLKKSLEHQQAQMTVVLQSITDRATIEAKDKGII